MCFTPLLPLFQLYHGDSSCLFWVSQVLGWGFEVSCPKDTPTKNPKDPVRLGLVHLEELIRNSILPENGFLYE